MPSFTICLFMSLSNSFKIFDTNLSLTGGGPNNATEMFAMNIYNEIFKLNDYGYGQAKAILFFLVVAAITLVRYLSLRRRGGNVMKKARGVIANIILVCVCLAYLFPIYIIVVNAFKNRAELYENVLAFRQSFFPVFFKSDG